MLDNLSDRATLILLGVLLCLIVVPVFLFFAMPVVAAWVAAHLAVSISVSVLVMLGLVARPIWRGYVAIHRHSHHIKSSSAHLALTNEMTSVLKQAAARGHGMEVNFSEQMAVTQVRILPMPVSVPQITGPRVTVQEEEMKQIAAPVPTSEMPSQDYAINQLQQNKLQVCLGISKATRKGYVRDLIGGTHYKVIGGSGFGKSCYAGSILDQVTVTNDADHIQIALLDLEHKTSRLFEDLPHIAQLRVGRKTVDCVATDANEVGEMFGYLHTELDRRAGLSEYDLQRQRLLLIYIEEFLSLKYEIDPDLKERMMADFSILALRARKYRMYLLACAQVSYASKDLREAEAQFNVRASFSVPPSAARAAGFQAGPLLKSNYEQKVPGQLVLETTGCSDIMLAPSFDVRSKLAELERSSTVQPAFIPANVHDFSTALNGRERTTELSSSSFEPLSERAKIWAEMSKLHDNGWVKQETVEHVCKCTKGGGKKYQDGCAIWDEMILSKEREAL